MYMYSIQEDSRGIFFYTLIKAKNLLEEKKKKNTLPLQRTKKSNNQSASTIR
jgi:hypothetical protein